MLRTERNMVVMYVFFGIYVNVMLSFLFLCLHVYIMCVAFEFLSASAALGMDLSFIFYEVLFKFSTNREECSIGTSILTFFFHLSLVFNISPFPSLSHVCVYVGMCLHVCVNMSMNVLTHIMNILHLFFWGEEIF